MFSSLEIKKNIGFVEDISNYSDGGIHSPIAREAHYVIQNGQPLDVGIIDHPMQCPRDKKRKVI